MCVFLLLFFLCARWYFLLSSWWKRWNQFYHYNISGCGEILSYKGLRQMGLISLQWDLKSETYQGISDKNCIAGFLCLYMVCCFFTRDDLFLFNTIWLGLLGMDSNGTLNPGNRLRITWVNMTYQIKDQYLPSIHFSDSGP